MTKQSAATKGLNPKALIAVAVVLVVFLTLLLAKGTSNGSSGSAAEGTQQQGEQSGGTSPTSVRNDAVADYEAALATGKPIYVLFHSLTCEPCVAISEVADQVVPDYEGEVAFVNAITDDASGQQLAANFAFQYIPTSFFVAPDGTVSDSFTGAMDEAQMRGYLDTLAAAQ